jgi:hypothetical protein
MIGGQVGESVQVSGIGKRQLTNNADYPAETFHYTRSRHGFGVKNSRSERDHSRL